MISEQQLISYLSETLTSEERAGLEVELALDPNSQRQLAEQQLIDQALRVALGGPVAGEQVKQSVLAVIRGMPVEQLRAHILKDTIGRKLPVRLKAAWRGLIRELREGTRTGFPTLWTATLELLAGSALRRHVTAAAAVVVALALGIYSYESNRPGPAMQIGKFAAITGTPEIQHTSERITHHAARTTPLLLGDRIETGDSDKCEIQFKDGTTLRLSFNTVLEISKAESKKQNTRLGVTAQRPELVKLLAGQILAKVQKLTNAPGFAVQTPVATANVKGTEFRLKVQKTKLANPARLSPQFPAKAQFAPGNPSAGSNPAAGPNQNRAAQPSVPATRPEHVFAVLSVIDGVVEFFNSQGTVQATAMTESVAQEGVAPTQPARLSQLKMLKLTRTSLSVENGALKLTDAAGIVVYPFGWTGVSLSGVSTGPGASPPQLLQGTNAVRVSRVVSGSPAAQAGMEVGDLIVAADGQAITNVWQVRAALLVGRNRSVTLTVQRAGELKHVSLITGQSPDAAPLPSVPAQIQGLLYGATWELFAAANEGRIVAGQTSTEELALEQLARSYPEVAAIEHNVAFLYETREQMDEAIRHYQRAVELDPQAALYHYNFGMALRSIGNLERALEELGAAARLAPAWPLGWRWLADVYTLLEQYDDAVAAMDAGLQASPSDATQWRRKAEILLRIRQPEAALAAALKAIELQPALADAYVELGVIYLDLGRVDEAEAAQRKAIELGPSDNSPYVDLGPILQQRGALDEAEAVFRRAVELEPGDPVALSGLGTVFRARGNMVEAEKWFRKAVEKAPDIPVYSGELGSALDALGRHDEAEQVLRGALERNPDDPAALNYLAWHLAERGLKLDEALLLAKRAIELVPDDAGFLDTLGWTYYQRGELDEAEKALQKAVALAGQTSLGTEIREHLKKLQEKKGK